MTSPHGQSWWAWPVLKYNLRSFLPNRNSWSCFDYIYAWLDSWPPGQASSWPEGGGGCEWTPALPRGPWYASGGAQNRYGHYPNPFYRNYCSILYSSVFKIESERLNSSRIVNMWSKNVLILIDFITIETFRKISGCLSIPGATENARSKRPRWHICWMYRESWWTKRICLGEERQGMSVGWFLPEQPGLVTNSTILCRLFTINS